MRTQFSIAAAGLVTAAMLLAVAGCGNDAAGPERRTRYDVAWRDLPALPARYDLVAVHATTPGQFTGVGHNGLIVHFDGDAWSEIFTSSAADLWAIWGPTDTELFAAGDGGVVLRRRGPLFEEMTTPTGEDLRGLWGSAIDSMFAVGDAGVVLRFDGSEWTRMESATPRPLLSVWGRAGDDVFAAGLDGVIVHFDGASWSTMDSGSDQTIACVHGVDGGIVIAVGNHGTILHYDGQSWQPGASGTGDVLQSVVATAPGHAIAVGANGTVLRWDGVVWSETAAPTPEWLLDITATSSSDLTAVGSHMILHYDGVDWAPPGGATPALVDAWSPGPGRAIAVAVDGATFTYAGERWKPAQIPRAIPRAVWGTSANDVYVVGLTGDVFHFDGSTWDLELGIGPDYYAVAGFGPDDIMAAGTGGRIVRKVGLERWGYERPATTRDLYGLARPRAHFAVAVGAMGEIVEWDGETWTRRVPPTESTLFGVTGHLGGFLLEAFTVIAVGAAGTVLHRVEETGEWEPMVSGVGDDLYAVASGPHGIAFAAGAGGTVLRLDRGQWSRIEPATRAGRAGRAEFHGLAPAEDGSVFIVGNRTDGSGVALRLEVQ